MNRYERWGWVVLGCVALATGCDGDEPSDEDYDEVARIVATQVGGGGGDIETMASGVSAVQGEAVAGVTFDAGETTWTWGGLMYTFGLSCWNEADASLDPCDDTTDRAAIDAAWSGEIMWPGFLLRLDRNAQWQVDGVQSDVLALSGDGDIGLVVGYEGHGGEGRFELEVGAMYDLQWDRAQHWVAGGELGLDVHAERYADSESHHAEDELDMAAIVRFDGSGRATLELDGSYRYEVDLDHGTIELGD